MKKAICTLLAFVLSYCFFITVHASTDKTVNITEKSGELVSGFNYIIDEKIKTVFIKGKGDIPHSNYEINWDNSEYGDVNNPLGNFYSYKFILDDRITGFSEDGKPYDILPAFERIYLGKDYNDIEKFTKENNDYLISYEVSPQNSNYSSYNGCIYTKNFKVLLKYPPQKAPNDFHPNLTEIGEYAFYRYKFNGGDTLVIPWGVTKINGVFLKEAQNGYYVISDTVTNVDDVFSGGYDPRGAGGNCPYWIPSKNNLTVWEKWHHLLAEPLIDKKSRSHIDSSSFGREWLKDYGHLKITDVPADNIAKYYGIKPNSLKTFQNGKTYYFDSNYKMATGWKKVNGTWYYFNDYGAAVVKIWLKSGGKWYYMQEDGTMATSKWIKWYNKWYYVGADGAMYANRRTPDGYWVNASGVWVK